MYISFLLPHILPFASLPHPPAPYYLPAPPHPPSPPAFPTLHLPLPPCLPLPCLPLALACLSPPCYLPTLPYLPPLAPYFCLAFFCCTTFTAACLPSLLPPLPHLACLAALACPTPTLPHLPLLVSDCLYTHRPPFPHLPAFHFQPLHTLPSQVWLPHLPSSSVSSSHAFTVGSLVGRQHCAMGPPSPTTTTTSLLPCSDLIWFIVWLDMVETF